MTQVISHGKRCHVPWCQQNTKKRLENSGFRKSEFRIQKTSEFRIGKLDRETSGFRIQETSEFRILQNSGNWISEFRKPQNLESGNCTGKLQNSENFRIQNSGNWISEFRKPQNSEYFRIQETGFQNRETGILKVGNWTGKLQDSEFRKLQNRETGPGNFRI